MLADVCFAAAGLFCGFVTRFGGFAIGLFALLIAYGVLLFKHGASAGELGREIIAALLLAQAGYAAAVLIRVIVVQLRR